MIEENIKNVVPMLYLSIKKAEIFISALFRTEGGNRTRTPCEQWILNPSCLPIPPLRLIIMRHFKFGF